MSMAFKFVNTATTGIRTTFGKAHPTLLGPGIRFYLPFVQDIQIVSNKIYQNTYDCQVKTKNDVLPKIDIAVQYQVKSEDSLKFHYTMGNAHEQMGNHVKNIIRSKVPNMTINQLYESQSEINDEVKVSLKEQMEPYGVNILSTLVTDISLPREIVQAKNNINAAIANKEAAEHEATVIKIKMIAEAEAERDRRKLHGEGISLQRTAILKGYHDSLKDMSNTFGIDPDTLMKFVLRLQHMDTLRDIGMSANTKSLFVPVETSVTENKGDSIRNQVIEAMEFTSKV